MEFSISMFESVDGIHGDLHKKIKSAMEKQKLSTDGLESIWIFWDPLDLGSEDPHCPLDVMFWRLKGGYATIWMDIKLAKGDYITVALLYS